MFPLHKNIENKSLPVPANICVVLILLFTTSSCIGQTRLIDSLRQRLYNSRAADDKLTVLFQLCEEGNSMNSDSLYRYSSESHDLAVKGKKRDDILLSLLYKATAVSKKGKQDSALQIIDSCLSVLKPEPQPALRFRFQLFKSNVLIRADRQKESMNNSLNLLHNAEVAEDVLMQIRAKIAIGWAFMELNQNRDALKWFFDAVKMEQTIPDAKKQPFLYSNIAAVYNNLFINDSAEIFAKRSLDIALKKTDLSYQANAYFIYAGIYNDLGEKQKTEDLLRQGLVIRKLIGDPFYIVSDIFQIGLFYANYGEPSKGITLLKEGIALAKKNNLYEKLPILYTALAKNYKVEHNLDAYGRTLDTLIALKDSLYKKNSAEALAEMQAKYDVEKKEKTIIQQQYDLTKKNIFIYGIAILFFSTLVFGVILFQNRKKNQRLKLQALQMEQKRKTAQAVMKAGEEERKRIAGELHDSVAQKMVVAKLNLEALRNGLKELGKREDIIYDNIQALLDESVDEVRKLSHSMMPQSFAKLGLLNAVKELLSKISPSCMHVSLHTGGEPTGLREENALMIYRIIQECVQNSLKHAAAARLDVAIICSRDQVDVTVEDNGDGFNVESCGDSGEGLKSIRSRIEYMNGRFNIFSTKGLGTKVSFQVPFADS